MGVLRNGLVKKTILGTDAAQIYYRLQGTDSCKSLAESIAPMLSSSYTDWYVGPGSPAVAASQTGSCTPLHNVLDPRVCAYFRPSARVIGLKHDAERGQPCASVYAVV